MKMLRNIRSENFNYQEDESMKNHFIESFARITRCKDCKHFYVGEFANGCFLDHDENVNSLPPDFFCADGERREEEG